MAELLNMAADSDSTPHLEQGELASGLHCMLYCTCVSRRLIGRSACVVSEEYYYLSLVLPDLYANTALIRFWRAVSKENVRGGVFM